LPSIFFFPAGHVKAAEPQVILVRQQSATTVVLVVALLAQASPDPEYLSVPQLMLVDCPPHFRGSFSQQLEQILCIAWSLVWGPFAFAQ